MKKLILSLLLCVIALAQIQAQTKSQILSDLRLTMQDFMSELNYINEDKDNLSQNIKEVSRTFGSDEYFMLNGKNEMTFGDWIGHYCTSGLHGRNISYSISVQENTVAKVKPGDAQDMRYSFNAVFRRSGIDDKVSETMTSWVVVWNGENRYVTIVEFHDNVKVPLPVILGEVVTGRDEFSVTLTKVRKQGTMVYIDMMLENTGVEDIIIDLSQSGSRLVAYDDKGNKYDYINIAIGDKSWMGMGLGAGNSRRKLMAGVPVKAQIRIQQVKPEAELIRRMNWHFTCNELDIDVNQPGMFMDMPLSNKPVVKPSTDTQVPVGRVVTGVPELGITVTKVYRRGSQVNIEMMLENKGRQDAIISQFEYGSGFVAYDDKGNKYGKIWIAIGDESRMGCGLGAGNSERKLIPGVPLKAWICIEDVKADASVIRRMDWHFTCKQWKKSVQQPVKFMNLDIQQ